MISDAQIQISWVIEDSTKKDFKKPEYKGNPPGTVDAAKYHVAVEAAKYHLAAKEWGNQDRQRVLKVINNTAKGLSAPLILSDVLSYSTVDLYKVYRDKLTIDKARHLPLGSFREATAKKNVNTGEPEEMEGYVRLKREVRESGIAPKPLQDNISDLYGSMHIEFALASIYPRPQMARVIVHEATHKFAGTEDMAYCLGQVWYPQMGAFDMTHNADSYTYVVLSIYCNRLIKNKEECFGEFPQYGPSEREHEADQKIHGLGHSKHF
jgi:hypothetical protein